MQSNMIYVQQVSANHDWVKSWQTYILSYKKLVDLTKTHASLTHLTTQLVFSDNLDNNI